jgi:hypothetical protein
LQAGWASASNPAWAGQPCNPAGPDPVSPAGPPGQFPGWAVRPRPRLGRPLARPRLGRLLRLPPRPASPSAPGWASSPARPGWAWLPRLGRLAVRPGWAASSSAPRLGRIRRIRPDRESSPGRLLAARLGRVRLFRLGQVDAPLAQARLSPGRPNYSSPGRDLPSPGHIPRPASPPAHRASPGTPPSSDWHILHRHMLVLGRPLAQTSISILS